MQYHHIDNKDQTNQAKRRTGPHNHDADSTQHRCLLAHAATLLQQQRHLQLALAPQQHKLHVIGSVSQLPPSSTFAIILVPIHLSTPIVTPQRGSLTPESPTEVNAVTSTRTKRCARKSNMSSTNNTSSTPLAACTHSTTAEQLARPASFCGVNTELQNLAAPAPTKRPTIAYSGCILQMNAPIASELHPH
jgi:hypothetical protein